ncbi:hypothetical protein, partial [Thermoanaerobacter sp. CM-CNRG TB177]|uniref:hypothetical protein n=1 Tax=Thermoanaerobacter sp. CM-CNRG TB177 TaxID=2800659 RepID=UPI001BDE67EB
RHAASVRPEPGSNSQLHFLYLFYFSSSASLFIFQGPSLPPSQPLYIIKSISSLSSPFFAVRRLSSDVY